MRIALLSFEYPPDTGFGGIGTYTWYQARALVRLGHEVHVVAGSTATGTRRFLEDGVHVTRVAGREPLRGAADGMEREGLPWAANRLRTAQAAYLALRDLVETNDFDVFEYPECGGDGLFASALLPVRTCVRFHSPARLIMGTYGADDADIEATSLLEQVGIEQADVRISPSRFLAEEVVARMGVVPPVHVVPNGIDLELFDRDEGIDVGERFGLPTGDVVTVAFSNRLEHRKGVRVLEEVVPKLLTAYPHVHVVLAGEDTEGVVASRILPRAEALGVRGRIHPLGRIGLAEVRAVLKHVDVHLQPTVWDNAPYSCIEAMAAGRSIVASRTGGIPELVRHERTGLLAEPGDPASFLEQLGRLIEDPELRRYLGAAARQEVERRLTDVAMAEASVSLWRAMPGTGT